jgi:AbrB family looped-hinge helix DNA binding protein
MTEPRKWSITMVRRIQVKANGQSAREALFDKLGNSKALRTTLDAGGRVVIPAEFRQALGMNPGDTVLIRILDGEIHIYTFEQMTRQIQAWGAELAPPERVLSDELIAERRAEAARE